MKRILVLGAGMIFSWENLKKVKDQSTQTVSLLQMLVSLTLWLTPRCLWEMLSFLMLFGSNKVDTRSEIWLALVFRSKFSVISKGVPYIKHSWTPGHTIVGIPQQKAPSSRPNPSPAPTTSKAPTFTPELTPSSSPSPSCAALQQGLSTSWRLSSVKYFSLWSACPRLLVVLVSYLGLIARLKRVRN